MVKNKAMIVVGLGFGDEGKGITTDYLCLKNHRSIVVRFNGGHQAGHCVVTKKGDKHIFSNFGSGTFRNIPTFWSSYCVFAPTLFLEELSTLTVNTKIYIDYNCPVTTHYDILYNRTLETTLGEKRIGSCGVGFGATVDRQKKSISLLFKDLLESDVLFEKLKTIKKHYRKMINLETSYDFDSFNHDYEDLHFIESIEKLKVLIDKGNIVPVYENEIFSEQKKWSTYIFEGAQGVLLDQTFGQKPHITKSNTTSRNAIEMINRHNLNFSIEIWYVTRSYQTRHGAGPFKNNHPNFELINTENETNLLNEFQGEFRSNFLDINDLNYALKCDRIYSEPYIKNLMITCLDHFREDKIPFYRNNKLELKHFSSLSEELECNFQSVNFSFSNCAENIL